jgi:hypothetical protein
METKAHETTGNQNAYVDFDPPMSLDKFIEQTGLSAVTGYGDSGKRISCGR